MKKTTGMDSNFQELSLNDLRTYIGEAPSDNLSDDFLITSFDIENGFRLLNEPFRFDGFLAMVCLNGHFTAEINLNRYEVKENSLLIYVPGYIMRFCDPVSPELGKQYHFTVMAVSSDFFSNTKMDLVHLFSEAVSVLKQPIIQLDKDEIEITRDYLCLATKLKNSSQARVTNSIRGLLTSTFYYFGDIWQSKIQHAPQITESRGSMRSKLIFNSFLELVAKHHDSERGMAFYAKELCLTPKYLSSVIKKVSGKSGPNLIDDFVVLEAKNLLRYSDYPIKEIVYRLNFSNSSVFYKFFKSHTGLTPSEYRK